MKVGFIGLGNVGGKLAGSLLRNKYDLSVIDLDSSITKDFVAKGASATNSPKELAQKVDLIITCLPSPSVCSEVMESQDGVINGLSKNKIWLEMSTTDEYEVKRLGELVKKKELYLLTVLLVEGATVQLQEIFQSLLEVNIKFLKKYYPY